MLPVTGRGNEEGGHHLMGEMKRRQCSVFPLAVKVDGGGHGGGARPVTAAVAPALFSARGGRNRLGQFGHKG
jgi:ribosomal protein S9